MCGLFSFFFFILSTGREKTRRGNEQTNRSALSKRHIWIFLGFFILAWDEKQCWCGGEDAEAIFEANGEVASACNEDCTGDSSETCGGFLAMSVYSSQRVADDDGGGTGDDELPEVDDESVAPEAGGYEGCFADPKGNRSMAKVATTDDMTSEVSKLARDVR